MGSGALPLYAGLWRVALSVAGLSRHFSASRSSRNRWADVLGQLSVVGLLSALSTERGLLPRGSSRPPKDGLRWTKDAIARVLRNPLYAGFMMYGDEL